MRIGLLVPLGRIDLWNVPVSPLLRSVDSTVVRKSAAERAWLSCGTFSDNNDNKAALERGKGDD